MLLMRLGKQVHGGTNKGMKMPKRVTAVPSMPLL